MSNPRSIIQYLLGENSEEFAEWAWGANFREVNFEKMPCVWNDLHSKDLTLYGDGVLKDDIPKMIEIWKLSKKEKDHATND